jgi:hypothetical protein
VIGGIGPPFAVVSLTSCTASVAVPWPENESGVTPKPCGWPAAWATAVPVLATAIAAPTTIAARVLLREKNAEVT